MPLTLTRKSDDAHFTGLLRNAGGADTAGSTMPNYPARLEGNSTGSWSITISDDVALDLDRIEFDVRAATGESGHDCMFNTSLDCTTLLWEDYNLQDETPAGCTSVSISAALSIRISRIAVAYRSDEFVDPQIA